jgi:hypothetical protein
MSDISEHPTSTPLHDINRHPDLPEMRERYERLLRGRQDSALDGMILLTGLYAAVSPWIVHFSASNPDLRTSNLIVGLAVAVFGLGLTMAPERMGRLGWACAAAGVWLIVTPWVATVGHHPTTGMIWNNVLVGAVVVLLGCATAGIRMATAMAARRNVPTMSSAHPSS